MPRIENGTAISLVKSNASLRPAIRLTMWSAQVSSQGSMAASAAGDNHGCATAR